MRVVVFLRFSFLATCNGTIMSESFAKAILQLYVTLGYVRKIAVVFVKKIRNRKEKTGHPSAEKPNETLLECVHFLKNQHFFQDCVVRKGRE